MTFSVRWKIFRLLNGGRRHFLNFNLNYGPKKPLSGWREEMTDAVRVMSNFKGGFFEEMTHSRFFGFGGVYFRCSQMFPGKFSFPGKLTIKIWENIYNNNKNLNRKSWFQSYSWVYTDNKSKMTKAFLWRLLLKVNP